MFLQYCPVLCRVSGNVSESLFLLALDFAVTDIHNCDRETNEAGCIANTRPVVVAVKEIRLGSL